MSASGWRRRPAPAPARWWRPAIPGPSPRWWGDDRAGLSSFLFARWPGGGLRRFRYESVYFDTPDRRLHRLAAHRRPQRFKVRTRLHADSGECRLELKQRDRRGWTVRRRAPHHPDDRTVITEAGRALLTRNLPAGAPRDLHAALTTAYRRTTLLDRAGGIRVTLDTDLTCTAPAGAAIGPSPLVIIETKSASPREHPARPWPPAG